jgi:hypothetical protein
MLAEDFSVRDALHQIQRDLLAAWREAGDDLDLEPDPPVLWAGYVALGAFGRPQPLEHTRPAGIAIGTSAVSLLNDAGEVAGQEPINAVHLASAALLWGEGEELPIIRLAPGIYSVFLVTGARRVLRWMLRQSGQRQAVPITPAALSILAAAGSVAMRAGSRQVRAEHIVYSLTTNATGFAQLLIRLIPGARGDRFKRHLLVSARESERDHDPSRPSRYLTPDQLTAFTTAATTIGEASTLAAIGSRSRRR